MLKENGLDQSMSNTSAKPRPRIKVEETTEVNLTQQPQDMLDEENKVSLQSKEDYRNESRVFDFGEDNTLSVTSFAQLDSKSEVASRKLANQSESKDQNINQIQELPRSEQDMPKSIPQETVTQNEKLDTEPDVREGSQAENFTSEDIKKWLEEVKPDTTKSSGQRFPWGKLFFLVLVMAALGALAGGIYFYQKSVSIDEIQTTPTPTPFPLEVEKNNQQPVKETPTPTPQLQVDLSKFNLLIKNGTGIPGEAGKVSTLLTSVGFAKAATGNAANFNFKDTEVMLKASVPDSVFEIIKVTLEKDYVSVVRSAQDLSARQSYDIVITTGQRKDKVR